MIAFDIVFGWRGKERGGFGGEGKNLNFKYSCLMVLFIYCNSVIVIY